MATSFEDRLDSLLRSAGLGMLPDGGALDDVPRRAAALLAMAPGEAVRLALAEAKPGDPLEPADPLDLLLARGVVGLAEAWQLARPHAGRPAGRRLLERLARRLFYRLLAQRHGEAIRNDLGEPVVDLSRRSDLPPECYTGRTGLRCMDFVLARLADTGLVARIPLRWLASWLIHHRGVDWRTVYETFAAWRLDGEEAYDRLELQEIAGILASRPYFFIRDDVQKTAGEAFCGCCPAACPFAGTRGEVAQRLFGG